MEFCYGERDMTADVTMFDEEYTNYVKRREEEKQQAEEQKQAEKESRKSSRPKKMAISSLFLQDIKAKEEKEARRSEISRKRKRVLAKRAKKKSKLSNTKTARKGKEND